MLYKNEVLYKKQGIGYFIKESNEQELKNKYLEKLNILLTNSFDFATALGLDNETLKKIINDILNSKKEE